MEAKLRRIKGLRSKNISRRGKGGRGVGYGTGSMMGGFKGGKLLSEGNHLFTTVSPHLEIKTLRVSTFIWLKVETVSTFSSLKVETVSTFNWLKVETVSTFN